MPKFFVFSDVHSFYDELITALTEAGYDKDNPDHWIISCGDNWDRGKKPVEVFHFLNLNPRAILVRGNHEDLFDEVVEEGSWKGRDVSNGTKQTIEILGKEGKRKNAFPDACAKADERTRIFRNKMLNYFETEHFVFVHGWLPAGEDWRNASDKEWAKARWLNGMESPRCERKAIGKTVVFGHITSSYGHYWKKVRDGEISIADVITKGREYFEFGPGADFSPYYEKGIIAIDSCTIKSHKVNVLVIEDDFIK